MLYLFLFFCFSLAEDSYRRIFSCSLSKSVEVTSSMEFLELGEMSTLVTVITELLDFLLFVV